MLRILYGGTFDPVHEGHLAIARTVADEFGQPVSLIPSADPPHRSAPGADAEQRACMLDLAVAGDPRLSVDRRELRRHSQSFTIDTLTQVRQELGPAASIIWVLGIDSLVQLDTWREWRRMFSLAHVLGAERPQTSVEKSWLQERAPEVYAEVAPRWREPMELAHRPCGLYAPLPIRPLRMESATDIRHCIASGQPWADSVPAAVAEYIRDAGLYRSAPGR
ncbi:MAG: nicotinate-nucleotide adenylyltransferase [Arenimonas sp.]|jgi:nicotinate-nucleotide adenylyltransferase